MSVVGGFVQPMRFQRAMVFIDGTNLFHRLEAGRLSLIQGIGGFFPSYAGGRQILRAYLYTIQEHLDRARGIHGDYITDGVRVVLGHGIPTGDGNVKEKGVDALLVADLVYHAAVRNYEYALLVSTDTDFVKALHRVEDFGCRTGVLAVCADVPSRLQEESDEHYTLTAEQMIKSNDAKQL